MFFNFFKKILQTAVKQENILVITITTINSKIAVMVQGFDNSYVRFFIFFLPRIINLVMR
jgi:hypothetical protein